MRIKLLLVEDDDFLRTSIRELLPADRYVILEARTIAEGRAALEREGFGLVLLDLSLPDGNGFQLVERYAGEYRNRIVILTGTATVQLAVEAMKRGVFDFLEKPVNADRLIFTLNKAAELVQDLVNFRELRRAFGSTPSFGDMVINSPAMELLIEKAKKISQTDISVLISGETGTGKEIIAHSLHHFSRRQRKPFIAVNCASIPENLAESELFGYARGAFTGANSDYPGKFRLAHHGTLLLDEIGELPLAVQGKLLRALDSGEVSPLKSTKPVTVDVRMIAATNKDLEEEVRQKRFREDLFYRIAEVKIEVPPLRKRKEEIIPLARHFLKIANIINSKNITGFDQEVEELFLHYNWPGNIRELKNTINEISTLVSAGEIRAEHLPSRILKQRWNLPKDAVNLNLREMEKEHIIKVLETTGYDYREAVKRLGISRATLYRKIREYRL